MIKHICVCVYICIHMLLGIICMDSPLKCGWARVAFWCCSAATSVVAASFRRWQEACKRVTYLSHVLGVLKDKVKLWLSLSAHTKACLLYLLLRWHWEDSFSSDTMIGLRLADRDWEKRDAITAAASFISGVVHQLMKLMFLDVFGVQGQPNDRTVWTMSIHEVSKRAKTKYLPKTYTVCVYIYIYCR